VRPSSCRGNTAGALARNLLADCQCWQKRKVERWTTRFAASLGTARPPPRQCVLFNVEARQGGDQIVLQESLTFQPALEPERWTNRYVRVTAPPGAFVVEYEAVIRLAPVLHDPSFVHEMTMKELPLSVFPHLYPSRYCQSDRLERFARSTFGDLEPGYARVNGICNWIHDYVSYEGGVSDAMTSAFDTVTQRAGVCRDFAHLAIALCRTLGIPARYVSAYAFRLDPPDFHAVFEAWLAGPSGGGWYVFDPTRLADPAGLVRIGIGRDAAEVAFCSPYGATEYDKPDVSITAEENMPEASTQAVMRHG
jgi:transglutaminase-like putative cysteine protease